MPCVSPFNKTLFGGKLFYLTFNIMRSHCIKCSSEYTDFFEGFFILMKVSFLSATANKSSPMLMAPEMWACTILGQHNGCGKTLPSRLWLSLCVIVNNNYLYSFVLYLLNKCEVLTMFQSTCHWCVTSCLQRSTT